MAFCSFCGAQIMDGSVFCASCGAKQGEAAAPAFAGNQSNSIQAALAARMEITREMDRMIQYFGQKWEQYKRHDDLIDGIAEKKKTKATALLVWGILMLSGVGFLITLIVAIVNEKAAPYVLVTSIVLGLGMIGGYCAIDVTRTKQWKAMYKELCGIREELKAHYDAFGPCLVGMTYTNPAILTSIKATIQEGRADSPRDAINIMLDDVHKNEMEALAEQTLIATKQAAANAGESAMFAAASFFFK